MLKHTQGEWALSNPVIDCVRDMNYFYIKAGKGFYTFENKDYDGITSGFEVRGHLQRGDAVLLANAKKMYDLLTQVSEIMNQRQLDEVMELVPKLLAEMETQALEKPE
ncbi:MAG: hypothetical protein UX75_C0059G0014 [Candidatus Moranbacteria bacterium GW2011_GWE2_47_10]|nr:MAG: hypothetical protein UX75_C0059G0014 [Candidatus Moranbacteria bacterium GW2011_GWE2_47_10]